MGVVPNRYKCFGLLLALSLFSCDAHLESNFTSEGLHLNDETVFVSDLNLDSIDFASGKTLWMFKGSINVEGEELNYQVLFERNPVYTEPKAVHSTAPIDFKTGSPPYCVVTERYGIYEISWRSKEKFLHLKSPLTSTH